MRARLALAALAAAFGIASLLATVTTVRQVRTHAASSHNQFSDHGRAAVAANVPRCNANEKGSDARSEPFRFNRGHG